MAATPQQVSIMHKIKGIIALDLDGTLLNSDKQLTDGNLLALKRAHEAGYAIVPTTGRFYGGMPEAIRALSFVRYVITINGAAVQDLETDTLLYRAEIPHKIALDLMEELDRYPLLYDCYMENDAFMSERYFRFIEQYSKNPHYQRMLRSLRKPVPELKSLLKEKANDVQKVQFFTDDAALRLRLMEELPKRYPTLITSSSVSDNVEINDRHANQGEALLALATHLGLEQKDTIAFGDGLNDLSMIRTAHYGIAMANAAEEVRKAATHITRSCDEDGVAYGIEQFVMHS